MQKANVLVAGMTCGSCVRRVQKALAQVDGLVVDSIDRKGAQVTFDPGKVGAADIVGAVADAGYEARMEVRS